MRTVELPEDLTMMALGRIIARYLYSTRTDNVLIRGKDKNGAMIEVEIRKSVEDV